MLPLWTRLLLAVATLQPPAGAAAAEVDSHLAALKRQVEDPSLDLDRREAVALEMAGTLDRAARSAPGPDRRRERWSQAIDLLDEFSRRNPTQPSLREFRLQAAVYRWAQALSWRGQDEASTTGPAHRSQQVEALDDAIRRLREVPQVPPADAVSDNVRYRLARALADRAELEPEGSPARAGGEAEALALLSRPVAEPALVGFVELLRAELLARASRFADAERAYAAAAKAPSPPSPAELTDAHVAILEGQRKYAEALARIDASPLDEADKALRRVRTRLAERAAPGADGDARRAAEAELFRLLASLRGAGSPVASRALAEAAAAGFDPEPRLGPEACDLLADGWNLRGDPARAASLEALAAERADRAGEAARAAAYRLRGGGFLYQARKYAEADALLSRVADDPAAGPARPKAGMLRALARGRALAEGLPGSSQARYAEALERQIRDFPDDPNTAEARWLLGAMARAGGDEGRAERLWTAIEPASPRWLDSRLAVARLHQARIDRELPAGDRPEVVREADAARKFLEGSVKRAASQHQQVELWLAESRLELTPAVGRPERARSLADRVGQLGVTPVQLYRSRLYRMIALVELARYVEAEREAHAHATWAEPGGREALIEAIRLLDLCASTAELDLPQRRYGLAMRLLLQPLLAAREQDDPASPSPERSELAMRMTRALLFLGDDRSARASLASWSGAPPTADDALLRDLADTYSRLEAYSLAIDVQRLRARNLPAGSPAWFEVRYALALAAYHAGQKKEAARLIDATAILHPELGGPALQQKFIRLRQRIGNPP